MELIKTESFTLACNIEGESKSPKVAMVLPGRLDTKDYECFNSHLITLSKHGFLAISFDPPGTWESSGDIELYTTTNYIKAVAELIEYFGNKSTVLLGHSRGGEVAILTAAQNRNVSGVIVVDASFGPPTAPTQKERVQGFAVSHRDFPPGTSETPVQKEFRLSINYFTDGEKYDSKKVVANLKIPKLIFNSVEDEYNSPEEIKRIFDHMPEPKMLHQLPKNHDYRYYPEVISEINEIVCEFIQKYHL